MKEHSNRIEKFFKYYKSESTIYSYKVNLRLFFRTFYGEGELVEQAERYFQEPRVYEDDINSFFDIIQDRPPKSVTTLMSIVRTFLLDNDVQLQPSFWRTIKKRKRGNKSVIQDRIPTEEELQRI